tara:strand:- start:779 stop:1081 length:303 start_codon:yes stop_codon:yes gene_type:complete
MSKEIIDELKLIHTYFDVSKLDVYEHKHHIRLTSIIKDRIDFYVNKSKINQNKKMSKEDILDKKLKENGIRKGWIKESKQAVLDAMEEYAEQKLNQNKDE